jgi:hypothetical protein
MGLAKSLGLDERTVHALIVNPSRETYHSMKKDFSLENLADFIEQFHRQPELIGEAKLSHGHLSKKTDRFGQQVNHFVQRENSTISVLKELSRDAFLHSDRTKPLLLLYLSPSCGFCTAATRAFHAVRRVFNISGSSSEAIINFSTINISKNDLPWSFTAFSSPSVIFVPSG